MWSTGIVKKPWIWPACRSIVSTRSAPASCSMSATRRAEIGSRGLALRSWRAYGYHGTTAVMRLAEASLAAWIISSSSIRFWSTGSHPVCTRKRSAPRIDSSKRTYVSPLPNVCSSIPPSSTPSGSAIREASARWERPENTISRFCGPRSSQWPVPGLVTVSEAASRPGSVSSVVALPGCIALLVLLARPGDPERICRDVLRYDRTRCNPCSVPDLDRRHEAIVDTGPDVATDRRPALRPAGLVREVRRDRACADVRVRADVRVADVREVGHFRAVSDP